MTGDAFYGGDRYLVISKENNELKLTLNKFNA